MEPRPPATFHPPRTYTGAKTPSTMAQRNSTTSHPEIQFRAAKTTPDTEALQAQFEQVKRLLAAAQEEIDLLTGERDELVAAIRQWAEADQVERMSLLFDATTQDMRSEIKMLRGELKRMKREQGSATGSVAAASAA